MDTSCVLSVFFYFESVMMARLQMKFVFVFNALLYISFFFNAWVGRKANKIFFFEFRQP